ncbi:MAG: Calx-beta domain-containing protein, partial [Mycobacterium sp.]|nr:Calx-beta domain-containing protein [Mycobacterium sp.]
TQVSLAFAGDAAPGTDYRTINPVLTLSAGSTSTSVTINTLVNPVIQPDRHIVVSINAAPGSYSIGSPAVAVITVSGATGSAALPVVTLRSAVTSLVKGQPYAVTVGLSQAVSSSLTMSFTYGGTAVQGTDYSPPAGSVVVPAGSTSAQVTIPTITDDTVEADKVLTVSLASSPTYQIGSPSRVSVTITSSVLPTLSITIGTPTVTQGSSTTFTISADQAPVKDTSVSYTVVGTAQPGQDYQPLVGTAVLKAGQTMVTVVLQSLDKDVVFEPTDMIVANWPIRVGQIYVKAGDPVAPGAPILSLTEPTFTVTLQASASDRTKLQLGQHCTVQLVGGENQVSGTISELDAYQTLISSGSEGSAAGAAGGGGGQEQVYEGQIEVPDLGAADGAAVTIDVVDQQATNVLTVPIAAVKQNGVGQEVVRVINVAQGGKVVEVPVS